MDDDPVSNIELVVTINQFPPVRAIVPAPKPVTGRLRGPIYLTIEITLTISINSPGDGGILFTRYWNNCAG